MFSGKMAVIIPAYNEEESIAAVLAEVREVYPDALVFVMDDGSMDATSDVARASGAHVLRLPVNRPPRWRWSASTLGSAEGSRAGARG